jgi:hypothetical protein
MSEFVLIKNNGIGTINDIKYPNCCLFISLGIIWRYIKYNDFILHKQLFEEHLQRSVSPEEIVFSVLKVKNTDLVETLGEQQIDTLIEKFIDYTNIKISIVFNSTGDKWDLFKDNSLPEAVIIQYNNHFECALPKSVIQQLKSN